ncbi:Hypothetical predicted protein [Pelobates cultripes]|uniref:Uncharacterized protein n=1 Tax=Pelobates cultripes TaxID=61616 RepID=A0AAD1SNV4_PELCU|nr:Hypothetical predicted protein [Pelobates cultripes]
MQKQRNQDKAVPATKKTDKSAVGVSKGLQVHFPSHTKASRLITKAARSSVYKGDRAEDEGAGGGKSHSLSWSSAITAVRHGGGGSATRSSLTTDADRATQSPDETDMEDASNIITQTPLQQRDRKLNTTKMDDFNESAIASTKMTTTST